MKPILYLFILVSTTFSCNITTLPVVNTNETNYSILQDQITNDYRYVNEELRFIYDEKYNDDALKYKIYANDGTVLYSDVDKPISIKYGKNYIQLDFPNTTFQFWELKNPLMLEVTNAKNQKQYLKFQYSL